MNTSSIKELLLDIGLAVNKKCRSLLKGDISDLSNEVKSSPADIIYKIDIEAEEEIVSILNDRAEEFGGIQLIAEGIGEDDLSFYPADASEYKIKIICDPIDGSRGLMYGKRPAFFLAAAGTSSAGTLKDMEVSVMVELPIPKQGEFDVLSAVKGQGAEFFRYNESGESRNIKLTASHESSIEGGFISMAKFCFPGKDLVARVEETFLQKIFADREENHLPVFDDQYICTGGQLYELISGHDRLVADFRASMYKKFKKEGKREGQVCHPYDMAGLLVAIEAGVIVEDLYGNSFDCALSTDINIDWIGYANSSVKEQCYGPLCELLKLESII